MLNTCCHCRPLRQPKCNEVGSMHSVNVREIREFVETGSIFKTHILLHKFQIAETPYPYYLSRPACDNV